MSLQSYEDYINKPSSEKIVLAHLHGVRRLSEFQSDSGLYSQAVDRFVTEVSNGTTELERVSSKADLTDSTKFYYDLDEGKLYLYSFNTLEDEIITTFRFFLSNAPINLPWDLKDTSQDVIYEPIINSNPEFKSKMTQGKGSVNLIGSGKLSCENLRGYFDGIYDKYIFDNQKANIYSYNRELNPSQTKIIFRGHVTGKVYQPDKVDFKLTDDIYSLEQKVSGSQYLSEVIEDDRLNFKRKVYGRVDNLQVQSIDQSGNGLSLIGTLSGARKSKTVKGSNTSFKSQLSEDDDIEVAGLKFSVDKVLSDTTITISSELDKSFNNQSATYFPKESFYTSNREFQVSDHALKQYSATITEIKALNRLVVDDSTGFKPKDIITIGGTETNNIKRVSGNEIVLSSNYNLPHSVGETVSTDVFTKIAYGKSGIEIGRDEYSVNNTSSGAFITLSDEAEIKAAKEKTLKHNFYFREGHSKVWLGTPGIFKFDTVASTSGSLLGKYFIVYDEDDDGVAFWYAEDVPEGTSDIQEPDHGESTSYSIKIGQGDYTASEIASLTCSRVLEEMDFYTGFSDEGSFTLETATPTPITFGDEGTTGFTHTSLVAGVSSEVDVNLSEIVSPRDFIRDIDKSTEYEVLSADNKIIHLRSNYLEPTGHSRLVYKPVEYIQDDTPVYVNCRGKTKDGTASGELIRTASEVVSDLLDDAGLGSFKNTESFEDSSMNAPQLVSLALPFEFSGDMPSIKEVVNRLNESVFGSLFVNQDLELGYDILDASLDVDSLRTISDHDILRWSTKGDGFDISKKVVGSYRFVDYSPESDGESNLQVTYTSEFVEKYVGNNNTRKIDLYLYDTDEAQEQVERDELINSLSGAVIKIKGSLNLAKFKLGERVILNFRRLYESLGGSDRLQVAVITSLDNSGREVKLELESLGALYSRAALISEDSAVDDYSNATPEEKITTSFIVDDNGLIDNSEDTNNTSLIS